MRWVDIILLASLYSVRVGGRRGRGGVWRFRGAMLFFIFPGFSHTRRGEAAHRAHIGDKRRRVCQGRGYGRPDRGKLLNFAVVSMISALLIFFIYSQSAQAMALYPDRWFLWLAILPLAALALPDGAAWLLWQAGL